MATSTYIESEMIPIGEFLSNAIAINVPTFQRDYAWTDEETKQLWKDIVEALDTNQPEYFLGPMVLKKNDHNLEIIDGQQRIATVYVVLSVMRQTLKENGDPERAEWFTNEYFGRKDVVSLQILPKFHMNEINNQHFQKHIIAENGISTAEAEMKKLQRKDSNYLLLQAITTITELMDLRQKQLGAEDASFDLQDLLKIQEYLAKHVHVLLLKVTDEADAYVIFETLNDRGKGLTVMDLLKNHAFGKSGQYLEQVKTLWTSIRDNLADVDPRERFLNHYWASMHGRTSRTKLFREMRKHITKPVSALKFVQELSEGSRIYAALSIPGHPYWNEYDQRTRDNLETLNLLSAQQALPILLAAAEHFTKDEFGKLTDVLVTMAVRYNLIGELRTGVLSNYYSELPPKIRSGKITKSSKVFRSIAQIYPNDSAFKEAFAAKALTDSRKARYLLSELEKSKSGWKHTIVKDTKTINLEHILPRNPSPSDWKATIDSIGSEGLSEYTNRLGNLALVSTPINRKLGRADFEQKKQKLFSSEASIFYTHMLVEYSSWLKEDIENRQQTLAEQAVKTWRIDIQ